MKKKIYRLSILTFILLFCSGCLAETLYVGAYVIEGAKLAATLTSSDKNSSSEKQPDLILGKEQKIISVGNHKVGIYNGSYKGEPYIIFIAFSNGQPVGNISFNRKNIEDEKMINNFNQMDEIGKEKFIKAAFLQYAKIDLGPIAENVAPEKTETISSATIPAMGFR